MNDEQQPTTAAGESSPRPSVVYTQAEGVVTGVGERLGTFVRTVGEATTLFYAVVRETVRLRVEPRALLQQFDKLGVRSLGIAAATAIFVGIVMAIQFAFSLEKFGAKDSVGRIVGLSEARELAPSLTALVVGSRITAGIAAELGSMVVTEQVDAIRALGADPIVKLVVPRVLACTIVMPLIASLALVLGVLSALLVCWMTFAIPMPFFLSTAVDSIRMQDLMSGLGKTPFFGCIIALLGCYFGLHASGGTEGVGKATTTSVVVVSVTVLVADAILTQFFLSI